MNAARKVLNPGFTLIELLISISIITIITGASLPSFNNYINNQNTKQSQEKVKDDLRTVQNRALNGQDALVELSSTKVEYWGIEYVQDSGTYTYFISVDTSTCGASATRQDFRVSDPLPAGNVVRSASGCVFFSFDNADASFNPSAAATIIVGPASGSTGCKRVTVSASGLIQTNDSETSCTL